MRCEIAVDRSANRTTFKLSPDRLADVPPPLPAYWIGHAPREPAAGDAAAAAALMLFDDWAGAELRLGPQAPSLTLVDAVRSCLGREKSYGPVDASELNVNRETGEGLVSSDPALLRCAADLLHPDACAFHDMEFRQDGRATRAFNAVESNLQSVRAPRALKDAAVGLLLAADHRLGIVHVPVRRDELTQIFGVEAMTGTLDLASYRRSWIGVARAIGFSIDLLVYDDGPDGPVLDAAWTRRLCARVALASLGAA